MTRPPRYRFDRFTLDPADRRLCRDGVPVDLNARYLDALALLVGDAGKLVSKDRFLAEVWRGVPVTDEALTQCIKTLRRQLGDDAAAPRFIETVPKHGYRFIAPVAPDDAAGAPDAPARWRRLLLHGAAATVGGGGAGLVGGLFYGFASTLEPGLGAASVLLVLICLTGLVGLLGGAGVGFGIAAAGPGWRRIAGGALGGLAVGAVVKLLGLDAFALLFGQAPGAMTGAGEGLLLGAAVGLGAAALPGRRAVVVAGLAGGAAGAAIPLLGGQLMGGSLASLAQRFPASRLRLDAIGALFGERGFGPVSQSLTGALEGALFAGSVVAAMFVARNRLR